MKKKKKKKKAPVSSGCYVEELKKWVSIDEAVRWSHEQMGKQEQEVELDEVSQSILYFLEDQKGSVVPISLSGGWYKGLKTHLKQDLVDPDQVTLDHIERAWRAYRRAHPYKRLKTIEVLEDPNLDQTGKRTKLFGFHVTAVLRWMGTDMWEFDEAKRALTVLKVCPADTTIRIQLRAGRVGERGEPADLRNEDMSILYEAAQE